MRFVSIFYLGVFALQACQQDSTIAAKKPTLDIQTDLTAFMPKPMELADGCVWKAKELEVFEDANTIVSFRYANCGYDESANFFVSDRGTRINKAFVDVVYDGFYIFKRTDESMNDFIENLPVYIHIPGENCEPKQISDRYWIIDDGMAVDKEINELPCGRYGRNFAGQKIFEVRDGIVLNYNTHKQEDGIDKMSIELKR